MTLIEEDLLGALRELYESSKLLTNGQLPSAADMERYHLALARAERMFRLAESEDISV